MIAAWMIAAWMIDRERITHYHQALSYRVGLLVDRHMIGQTGTPLASMTLTALTPDKMTRRSLLGAPHLEKAGDGILIQGNGRPAGMELDYAFDPAIRYRVTVTGRALFAMTNLRIGVHAGDAPVRWQLAPNGSRSMVIEKTGTLRMAFYADQAFAYRLEAVDIQPCPECLDDAAMKQVILDALPGLEGQLRSHPAEAARRLLHWTAESVNVTQGRDTNDTHDLPDMTAAEIHQFLLANQRDGFWCGGASVFLAKIAGLFGIDAFTIDFGGKGFSHVTVVLALPGKEGVTFGLFDPLFDATFRTPDGSVADLAALLSGAPIRVDQGDLSRRKAVVAEGEFCEIELARRPDHRVCLNPSRPYVLETAWRSEQVRQHLSGLGLPDGADGFFPYMARRIDRLNGPLDRPSGQMLVRLLGQKGVPVSEMGRITWTGATR